MILRYALLALGVACLAQGAAAEGPRDFRQKWNLTRQDIVVAMPVDKNHLTLARGSRVWRRVSLVLPAQASVRPQSHGQYQAEAALQCCWGQKEQKQDRGLWLQSPCCTKTSKFVMGPYAGSKPEYGCRG